MLELYSLNIEVDQNSAIPLNNTRISKGNTATHNAPATIQLNKSGVYMIHCDASVTPAAAGTVGIQLAINNVLQLGDSSIATGAAATTTTLGFNALVQVRDNNTCCCNTSPTTVQLMNISQVDTTFPVVKVIVTKLC